MAFEPRRRDYTFSDFIADIPQIIGAAFTLLVIGVLALLLCAAAFTIGHAVWPNGRFTVDKNVVELVRAFVWPLALAIAIFFFVTSRTLQTGARSVFQRVTKLKAGSYEVSFSEEGAKQLKRNIEQATADFASESAIECTRSARKHRVRDALVVVLDSLYKLSASTNNPGAAGIAQKSIMATVHMVDVLYEDSLYQLLGYVPTNSGGGRRFSTRFGAIGTALRLGGSLYWNIRDPALSADNRLIKHYGMTKDEAAHADEIEYALAIPLIDSKGTTPGVFFLKAQKLESVTSATDFNAQKRDLDKFLNALEADQGFQEKLRILADAVALVFEDVSPSGTFIRVHS
ncbi:MAG TPA: hypothetical protein VM662_05660 [Sphingomonas sp.]|nr:hypothetical protein [Sphingomonas sp.]